VSIGVPGSLVVSSSSKFTGELNAMGVALSM
jgi:hypothetical protein